MAFLDRKWRSIVAMTLVYAPGVAARSWWSIDIPALDAIHNDDPLFALSSQLAMEDSTFLYGAFGLAESTIKSSSTNSKPRTPSSPSLTTYSTPAPVLLTETYIPSLEPSPEPFDNLSNAPTIKSSVQMVSGLHAPTNAPHMLTMSHEDSPTVSPTISQTSFPTWSPSTHYQAANGSCPPNEKLHRLTLYDAYRDGWGGSTELVIKRNAGSDATIFQGGMNEESEEEFYLCLNPNVCYSANVNGGAFLEEVSWEIRRVELATGQSTETVAKGVGEGGSCDFGLKDASTSCITTCDGTIQPKVVSHIETQSPSVKPSAHTTSSAHPTSVPSNEPTKEPIVFRTKRPTTGAPTEYLPQDKSSKFGGEKFKKQQIIIISASPDSIDALKDNKSPQFRAFEWLYNNGAIASFSDSRLVQRWILAAFYFGTNGDGWINKDGWLTNKDECLWYGVSCIGKVVEKIELEQNRLTGEIIPEIALWGEDLYVLSLGNDYDAPDEKRNKIVMPLPSFLGDLHYLSFLNLEGIGLTSTIPDELFSSWSHLESLYLNDNDIIGTIPRSIASATSLEILWLGGNNLGGPVVSEIGSLTSLIDLSLESNFREDSGGKRGLIMMLPSEIGLLTNLEVLVLADNALSGSVPMQLGDLISLRHLHLNGNFFEQQLPTALGKLEMLEELDVSFNWLSSTIPSEYGNMISLTSLSLGSNYKDENGYFTWGIHGKLPTELGELKNLQHLHLNDNYLSGSLISELGQMYLLETLHLQNNFLIGPIPKEYSNCALLEEILLEDNNIDGAIFSMPEGICRLPELELARVDCKVSCQCCRGC